MAKQYPIDLRFSDCLPSLVLMVQPLSAAGLLATARCYLCEACRHGQGGLAQCILRRYNREAALESCHLQACRQVKVGLAQCTLCRCSHEAVFDSIRYDPEACRHVKVKWRNILSTAMAATEYVMASLPDCSMSCSVHGGCVK